MHLEAKRLTTKYRASKMFAPVIFENHLNCAFGLRPATFMNLVAFEFSRKAFLAVCFITLFHSSVSPQAPIEPERNRLLNGLRVLIWSRPGDQDVVLKLRVHSGAAFDLAGKAGSMALLGDILFPDPATREYFTEEMQGRLNVTTDYDSLTVTMQGRAREFERIVEILRTALVTTQLTPENVAKVRAGRIKIVKETSISSAMLADRAIATRLFGDFPYGRPYGGSIESLERVERPDIMLARERFLNPNNSTLVVIGGIQPNRAMRALRQLLGVWRKSEQLVPPTFRQPPTPDPRTLLVSAPADQSVEVRMAVRGLSRHDKDVPAGTVLAILARQRWEKLLPELARKPVFVSNEALVLPGMFVMGASVDNLLAGKTLATARDVLKSLATAPVTSEELEQARSQAVALANKDLTTPDGVAEAWLDVDTYGLPSVAEQLRALNGVSASDVQRVATRLIHDGAFASVVVGNSDVVKTQIERYGKVEIMGEIDPTTKPKPESKNTEKPGTKSGQSPSAKPQTKIPAKPE
jgi:zinc protease